MARPIEEINQDYSETCARLGDSIYKRALLDEQIKQLLEKNSKLALEANEARATEGGNSNGQQSSDAN